MQTASRILGLVRQAVLVGILLVKLIHDIRALVDGATNYLCYSTILTTSLRTPEVG